MLEIISLNSRVHPVQPSTTVNLLIHAENNCHFPLETYGFYHYLSSMMRMITTFHPANEQKFGGGENFKQLLLDFDIVLRWG